MSWSRRDGLGGRAPCGGHVSSSRALRSGLIAHVRYVCEELAEHPGEAGVRPFAGPGWPPAGGEATGMWTALRWAPVARGHVLTRPARPAGNVPRDIWPGRGARCCADRAEPVSSGPIRSGIPGCSGAGPRSTPRARPAGAGHGSRKGTPVPCTGKAGRDPGATGRAGPPAPEPVRVPSLVPGHPAPAGGRPPPSLPAPGTPPPPAVSSPVPGPIRSSKSPS